MTDQNKKYEWFNALPMLLRASPITGDPYQRICPTCGASVWYESANSMQVESWMDIHFAHSVESEVRVKPTDDRYDFEREIKFSHEGFELFVQEFGLMADKDGKYLVYKDANKNLFAFEKHYENEQMYEVAPALYVSLFARSETK